MATIQSISEIMLNLYQNGRVKVTNMTLDQQDMLQHVRFAYANVIRNMWLSLSKGKSEDENYFYSSLSKQIELKLSEFEYGKNKRQASFGEFDGMMVRLPENKHIIEVIPVGKSCEYQYDPIPIVGPAEEKFYRGPEFKDFMFVSVNQDGLSVVNAPSSVKAILLTTILASDDANVPDDIAFDMVTLIMKTIFGVNQFDRQKIDDNSSEVIHEVKKALGMSLAK
jgi:hypothetical protein